MPDKKCFKFTLPGLRVIWIQAENQFEAEYRFQFRFLANPKAAVIEEMPGVAIA